MRYIIKRSKQTGIWNICGIGRDKPYAFSGSPDGGNVQALLNMAIGVSNTAYGKISFYLEVHP